MTVETFRDYRQGLDPDYRFRVEIDDGDDVIDYNSETGFPTEAIARAAGEEAELCAMGGTFSERIFENGKAWQRERLAAQFNTELLEALEVVVGDEQLVDLLARIHASLNDEEASL